MKSILIHPAYLPNIITVAEIIQADKVVFETHDNYQKQSFRNRTYIATSNGSLLLNIPVRHHKIAGKHKKTSEAFIENSFLWQRQHWRSIQIAYRTSPFFEFYEDDFEVLFNKKYEKLMDFNLASISAVLEALQVDVVQTNSNAYENETEFADKRYLIDAKRKVNITSPRYAQVFQDKHDFIPNLSVLDLLFNEGPNALTYLENLYLKI